MRRNNGEEGGRGCPSKFPYKLYLCLKDRPGSFMRVFEALTGREVSKVGKLYIDLHSFSLAPCERFSKLPWKIAISESVRKVIRVRKKYKLHSIVFIKEGKEINEGKEGNLDGTDKQKDEEKEKRIPVKGLLEIHACLSSDRVLDTVIDLINAINQAINETINQNQAKNAGAKNSKEVLYRALIITPIKARISKQIKCRDVLRKKLLEILVENSGKQDAGWCPERGTCPIAAAVKFFRGGRSPNVSGLIERLWSHSIIDTDLGRDWENDQAGDSVRYTCDAYFIRDHEDYTADRTFLEIYGVCTKTEENSGNGRQQESASLAESVNVLLISKVWWGLSKPYSTFTKEIKEIIEGEGKGEFLALGTGTNKDGKDTMRDTLIINKYFSCDDVSCDILRHFRTTMLIE